ncbi:hypothetical protein N3C_2642 [Clostridium sp. N3C]|uniref:hypothetical protein n=1 Tax=Clostridium sp. N3C TaxID=1776758 RepID=UPI00092E0FFB|nr:hypothetical protein [Clostridium sp. N3C]SCN26034.1 hypothetical protein N3C_2642 [Clostridium sp. N3C]
MGLFSIFKTLVEIKDEIVELKEEVKALRIAVEDLKKENISEEDIFEKDSCLSESKSTFSKENNTDKEERVRTVLPPGVFKSKAQKDNERLLKLLQERWF